VLPAISAFKLLLTNGGFCFYTSTLIPFTREKSGMQRVISCYYPQNAYCSLTGRRACKPKKRCECCEVADRLHMVLAALFLLGRTLWISMTFASLSRIVGRQALRPRYLGSFRDLGLGLGCLWAPVWGTGCILFTSGHLLLGHSEAGFYFGSCPANPRKWRWFGTLVRLGFHFLLRREYCNCMHI
jgi:hypothetical protein